MDGLLQVRNQVLSVSFALPVLHSLYTVQTSPAEEMERRSLVGILSF